MSNKSRDGPLQLLTDSLNKTVLLRIRGNREIRGILRSFDAHLNLYIEEAVLLASETENLPEEQLGVIILRGDNVIYVSPA
ncbi:MAG: LSM domain-containing protein [Candidatus Thorarchaeota archaeon]